MTSRSEPGLPALSNAWCLRQVLDGMFAFVGLCDLQGNLLEANRPPLELAGLRRQDVIGKPFWDAYWWSHSPAEQDKVRIALRRAAAGERVRDDFRVRLGDDHFITLDAMFGPVRDDEGRIRCLVGSGFDVTDQRKARDEREVQAQVLTSMSEGVLFVDGSGIIRFTNPALDDMFGYEPGELLGKHATFLNDASAEQNARIEADILDQLERNGRWRGEFRSRRKDGTTFFTAANITPLEHTGEVMWVSIQRDITDQKRAAARMRLALDQKETLLREVHHRVKNNLQIISSLLHFQAKQLENAADAAVFDEGRRRLIAMILVHDQLHRSNEPSQLDFGEYTRSLVWTLVSSFARVPAIEFQVEVESFPLRVDQALPAGMIVCELVTNIYKYAFPNDEAGGARVAVRREDGQVVVTVADNGIGFPDSFSPSTNDSFGWRLIRQLTLQLDGRYQLGHRPGARIELTFPIPAT